MKRVALLASIAAAAGLCPASPVFASDAEQAASPASPDLAALVAEIEAYGEADQSRDPEGDLVKLADLARRVETDGRVPPIERGLLASAIGAAHFYARHYDEAADSYGKAAELFEEGKAPPEEMAGLYNNQAAILASVGRYKEAEQSHLKALAIRKQMEGERGAKVASSLFGLAYVYFREGRVEDAIPLFRESVEQQVEFVGADDPLTIMRLASLGSVLGKAGREAEALEVVRRAETLGREYLGDKHPTYAIALNNLGDTLIQNGLYQEAVPVLREALRVRQQTVGEQASGTALSLRNLSTALRRTGHAEEAEALSRQALAIYQATGEVETPSALAYLRFELADFAAERGDWTAYAELAAGALAAADGALGEDNYDRAQIHLYHARRLADQGEVGEALSIAEQWVPVMQAALIPRHKDRIRAELLLARLRQQAGKGDAWMPAEAAIGELAAKLADLGASDRSLVREAETNRESALLYLEMALAADDPQRIFAALQLVGISDLSLGQQFAEDGRAAGGGAAQAARETLLDLARKAEETRNRYAASLGAGDSAAAESLALELARGESELQQAEAAFRRDFPDYAARFRPRPVGLAEFQAALRADDVLLAPVAGDGRSWIVSIARDGLEWHEADARALAGHVAGIRRSVAEVVARPDAFAFADAAALYRALFPGGVANGSRILFYGGGDLASVPLSLLLTSDYDGDLRDAPWLAREAAFQVVGNLALFGKAEARARGSEDFAFLGIGGPDLPGQAAAAPALASLFRSGRPALDLISDLPALPNARGELEQISAALAGSRGTLLIGGDAAEENLKARDLSRADLIVFATHGLVAGEVRGLWEPALLVGTGSTDGSEDGLLGASEIARLRLDADWVILSACNTAGGDGAGAPLYSGLATAFAQAGARSLMLSHWRVRDDAAARLSAGTVERAARGGDRAEALRRAQLDLIDDASVPGGAHPAIWAPFVIIQNW